jgi:hypothetical protein
VVCLFELAAPNEPTGRMPHVSGVSERLALGRRLGLLLPNRGKIFATEVEDPFTLGTTLGLALEAALPGIVDRIAAVVPTLMWGAAGILVDLGVATLGTRW